MASARLAQEAFRVGGRSRRGFPNRSAKACARGSRERSTRRPAGRRWRRWRHHGDGGRTAGSGGRPSASRRGRSIRSLGMSWAQLGQLARAYHQCQGTGQLEAFPGDASGAYALYDSEPHVTTAERDHSRRRRHVPAVDSRGSRWRRIQAAVAVGRSGRHRVRRAQTALDAFDARAPHKTLPHLAQGLARLRQLRSCRRGERAHGQSEGRARVAARSQDRGLREGPAAGAGRGGPRHGQRRQRGPRPDVWRDRAGRSTRGPEPMRVDDGRRSTCPRGWTAALQSRTAGHAALQPVGRVHLQPSRSGPRRDSRSRTGRFTPASTATTSRFPSITRCPGARRTSPPRSTSRRLARRRTVTSPAYYRYDGPWVGGEKQKIVNVVPALGRGAHTRTWRSCPWPPAAGGASSG